MGFAMASESARFSFASLLTVGTFRPDPARPHFGSLKHWNRSYHEHRTFSGTPGLVVNTNVNQFQLPTLCLSFKEYHTMPAWWPCGWEHAAPKRWRHCVSRLQNITSKHTSKVLDLVPAWSLLFYIVYNTIQLPLPYPSPGSDSGTYCWGVYTLFFNDFI